MAHPFHHALSSVKRWGGRPEDYQQIHDWFDESKAHLADVRHRALRHHSEGIFLAEKVFGTTLTNSAGQLIPVRFVGEQHVKEDLGWIPTLQDWFKHVRVQPWMARAGDRQVASGDIPTAPDARADRSEEEPAARTAPECAAHQGASP